MKKKFIASAVAGTLLLGSVTVFAWVIPGVDIPFDPPNYYNPLTVSIPDSAPSVFTMRDLARQGFQVQDVKMNSKGIVSQIKSLTEMVNQITSLGNQFKDLTSMSPEGLLTHYMGIDSVLKNTSDTWQAYNGLLSSNNVMDQVWNDTFRSVENFSNGRTTVLEKMDTNKKLLDVLEKTYKDSMTTSKNIGNQEKEIKSLEETLTKLENVNGNLENKEIQAQIESIKVAISIKRNLLLSNLVTLKTVEGKVKLDQEVKDRENTREGAAFGVIDPYHPSDYDVKKYERPKAQGFINF